MGKIKGKILLNEKKVRALMREVRKNQDIPRRTREKIVLVAKMANRFSKLIRHSAKFFGRYDECFPAIAGGICKAFYARDEELAICFGVSERTIREWRVLYPEFKRKIAAGKGSFTKKGGPYLFYRELVYPDIAERICDEFMPNNEQLAACFGVSEKKFERWTRKYPELSHKIAVGRSRGLGYWKWKTENFDRRIDHTDSKFECKRCGRCCLRYGADSGVSDEDIEAWEHRGRADILAWVGRDRHWRSPKTGRPATRCPWVRKMRGKSEYICLIEDVKPRGCRDYPTYYTQVTKDLCPGFRDGALDPEDI